MSTISTIRQKCQFPPSVLALAGLAMPLAGWTQPAPQPSGAAVSVGQPYSEAAHDALIRAGRSGQLTDAAQYRALQDWLAQAGASARPRLLADLLAFGLRTGQAQDALRQVKVEDVAALPGYALPELIAASRQTRRLDLQQAAVERMLRKQPQAWEPHMRKTQWLIDRGDKAGAEQALAQLAERAGQGEPNQVATQQAQLLELRGALAQADGDRIGAYRHYRALQELQPSHAYARQTATLLQAEMQAPGHSWSDPVQAMQEQWAALPRLDQARLAQQAMARRLDWVLSTKAITPSQEFQRARTQLGTGYERLLQLLATEEQQARTAGTPEQRHWQALHLATLADAMRLWLDTGRNREIVQAYEHLGEQRQQLPWYGKQMVAGAWTRLKNPARAVPLYEQAIQEAGEHLAMPSPTHLDLAYAYLDTGRYRKAQALTQQLVAATPGYMRLAPQEGTANNQYEEIQELQAALALYGDRLDHAERSFAELHQAAPGNAAFELGLARTQQLRGRPRKAEQMLAALRTDHPDDLRVATAQAEVQMDRQQYAAARDSIQALQQRAPDEPAIQRLASNYDLRTAGLLELDAGTGRDGGTLSNRDRRVDLRLTSPLLADHWRLFARQLHRGASLDGQKPTYNRTGVGVRWSGADWELEGEVHRANRGAGSGVAASASYQVDDAWRLWGMFDSNSPDVPWRARADAVRARRGDVGVVFAPSESRRFDLGAGYSRLSDGNRFRGWNAGWDERWYSSPEWKFSTQLQASQGRHARQDVPYFSPADVRQLRLGGRVQWETWKNGDRKLVQTLEAGAGRTWQRGYATRSAFDARYLHEWTLAPMTTLYYGIGWSNRPFDGISEKRREAFLGLALPLR